MNNIHIHIIKTGGTIEFIDPAYQAINKQIMKLDTSIDYYLTNVIKPHFTFSIESLVEKDSREIDDQDRMKIADLISTSSYENILITHGTFTMSKTARFLAERKLHKKIIITGSMIPITGFVISDAAFNLGYSIASFCQIETGVYIVANGGLFTHDEVEKNVETLRFE